MLRRRGDRPQAFSSPSLSSGNSNDGSNAYCQPQSMNSTPRMAPYKVPFQRRQPGETFYVNPGSVIVPQSFQMSSPYGLGALLNGPAGIYIPSVEQNLMESSDIDLSNNTSIHEELSLYDEQDNFVTGLTSSPPNHPQHQKCTPAIKNLTLPNPTKILEKTACTVPDNLGNKTEGLPASAACLPKIPSQKKNADGGIKRVVPKQSFDPSKIAMRVLTGTVEKIIKWEKMLEDKEEKQPFLFEIIAPLLQLKDGLKPNEKQLLLREPGGPVLSVMYYEIDQTVPQLTTGQYVRCVCRCLSKRRYQAFSVRLASQMEQSCLERLSFLSHRAVQEALLSIREP